MQKKIIKKIIAIIIVLIMVIAGQNTIYAANTTSKTTNTSTTTTKKSSNANLSMLGISPNDFTGFKPETTSYEVTVPNNVSEVNVYATKADNSATVKGTGKQTLEVGKNTLQVVVTAADGTTTKTYTITVTRKEGTSTTTSKTTKTTSTTSDVKNISIDGYTISPEFASDTYEYELNLTDEVSDLSVNVEKGNNNVSVEISGNKNLVEGKNIITVQAYNSSKKVTTTYQIVVNKSNENVASTAHDDMMKKALTYRYILIALIVTFGVISLIFIIVNIVNHNKRKKMRKNKSRYEYDDDDKERIRKK